VKDVLYCFFIGYVLFRIPKKLNFQIPINSRIGFSLTKYIYIYTLSGIFQLMISVVHMDEIAHHTLILEMLEWERSCLTSLKARLPGTLC
jgi:hypothetical protein